MRCRVVLAISLVVVLGDADGTAAERAIASSCLSVTSVTQPDPLAPAYEAIGDIRCASPMRIAMAVRSVPGQAWRILPGTVEVRRPGRWRLINLRPARASDSEEGFVARAIGLRHTTVPPTGWLTPKALGTVAFELSPAISIPRPASQPARDLEPKARIDRLDQREVVSDGAVEHDVGLQAMVQGRAYRPGGSQTQCVVQALGGDGRWVMSSGFDTDDRFFCLAQFGRSAELDLFERFLLYAVVTRPRLSPDHGRYSADEWVAMVANGQILAVSPPIRTRRTISLQPGQDGAAVSIHRVNGEEIIGSGTIHARQTSFIEGTVDGSSLASHRVAVYVRNDAPGSRWRRLGTALSNDARRWQLLPAYLGEPDQRLTLIAVRFHGQAPDLNREEDAHFIVAQSAMVRALVTELPIEMTHLGGRAVAIDSGTRAEAPLSVDRMLRIEGSKLDRQPSNIAVYARRTSDVGGWSLLASLPDRSGSRWETGDFALPATGEYVLTAAIGMSQVPPNSLPSGAGVRLSPPIFVKVER